MKYYKVQIEAMIEAKEISKDDLNYLLKGVELKSKIEHQYSIYNMLLKTQKSTINIVLFLYFLC